MYKKRSFSGVLIAKLDGLLNYLRKNRIAYTFHAEMKRATEASKPEPFYTVHWFEAANNV